MSKLLFIIVISIFIAACGEETAFKLVEMNAENILKACLYGEQKEMAVNVDFPEYNNYNGCEWGAVIDGVENYGILNGFIRARHENNMSVNLPENFILCGIEIESENHDLHYDDVLFFTMNKYILAAGSDSFTDLFEKESGIPIWDFTKIRNTKDTEYPWASDPYCLGEDSICEIPPHDNMGPFDLQFSPHLLSKISANLAFKKELVFSLITTGDNDSFDCFHTDFNLNVKIKYVTTLIE